MTEVVKELKTKMDKAEADGHQVIGIHLTAEMSKAIRWELHQMYGTDYGEPTLLFGAEVLSVDADELELVF
ncbi:MAG: hypothetical protein L3J28_01080 [Candidatus Polarisedimenticolaceae bacterium]|nr:hypothetical protein [Candidatus Polarisedimenticolaceae bacterium]